MSADQITPEEIVGLRESLEREPLTHDTLEPKLYFPKMCGRLLDALTASRAEVQRLTEEARQLRVMVQGQETECRHRERQDKVYRFQIAGKDAEIQRLRDELARRDEIELSEDVYGMLTAHGSDGVMLVCGEFASGREFREKYRVSRRSDAGRVEVPRISAMLLEQIDRASNGYEQMADALNDWVQPRLSPPPQPATGAVEALDHPKRDKDCGDCTRLAICNGELACLCGSTGKMFIRKPDDPQPSADVVVPSGLALAGIGRKHFGNPIPQAWYAAARELVDALRSSANHDSKETP